MNVAIRLIDISHLFHQTTENALFEVSPVPVENGEKKVANSINRVRQGVEQGQTAFERLPGELVDHGRG